MGSRRTWGSCLRKSVLSYRANPGGSRANGISRKKLGSGSEGVICHCKIPKLRKFLNTPLSYLIFRAHYHHPFQQITITCLQNISQCTESSSAVLRFWVWIPILQFTNFITLVSLFNLSEFNILICILVFL